MYKIGSGVTYDKPAFAGDDAAWPWLRQFAAAKACAMRLPSRCLTHSAGEQRPMDRQGSCRHRRSQGGGARVTLQRRRFPGNPERILSNHRILGAAQQGLRCWPG